MSEFAKFGQFVKDHAPSHSQNMVTLVEHIAMTSSRHFAPHLSDLRRYTRAIAPSEASADAIVYAALAGLVEAGRTGPVDLNVRLALYRATHEVWSLLARTVSDQGGLGAPPPWPPLEWATFLLTTMEQFTPGETAIITGQSMDEVEETLGRWIHAAMSSADFGKPPNVGIEPRWASLQGWFVNDPKSASFPLAR